MNLKHLSNEVLHQNTLSLAQRERVTTLEILWHLREIESRMLYAQKGYRDLKEYCVRELKYSEGSAWRRISAMRLLKDIPEIETKIESGNLNLTQLSKAQSHFREVRATKAEKKEVLLTLENQNMKITERILAEAKPENFVQKPEVIERPLKGQKLEVTLILDEQLQNELEEIQVLIGKPMSKLELLKLLTQEKLQKLRKQTAPKVRKNQKTQKALEMQNLSADDLDKDKLSNGEAAIITQNSGFDSGKKEIIEPRDVTSERKAQPLRSTSAAKSRYISRITLREMKSRDQHQCQYRDPQSQRQCLAKLSLQTEHIVPFAKGGTNELSNLQLLCSTHNRLRAVQQFGVEKMQRYLPELLG